MSSNLERTELPEQKDMLFQFSLSGWVYVKPFLSALICVVVLLWMLVNQQYTLILLTKGVNYFADLVQTIQFNHGARTHQLISPVSVYGFYLILALLVLQIFYQCYRIAYLHSILLFADKSGVWLYCGVFAWTKGITGCYWRDVANATSRNSLSGYLFNAYPINVFNRYTLKSEIKIDMVSNGKKMIEKINKVVREINLSEQANVDFSKIVNNKKA